MPGFRNFATPADCVPLTGRRRRRRRVTTWKDDFRRRHWPDPVSRGGSDEGGEERGRRVPSPAVRRIDLEDLAVIVRRFHMWNVIIIYTHPQYGTYPRFTDVASRYCLIDRVDGGKRRRVRYINRQWYTTIYDYSYRQKNKWFSTRQIHFSLGLAALCGRWNRFFFFFFTIQTWLKVFIIIRRVFLCTHQASWFVSWSPINQLNRFHHKCIVLATIIASSWVWMRSDLARRPKKHNLTKRFLISMSRFDF